MRCVAEKIQVNYPGHVKADSEQPVLYGFIQEESPDLIHSGKRQAVIVCPGGSYCFKSDREGEPVAMRFLAAGMQAFVLQYSVAPSRYPAALLELAAAVSLVRRKAAEWHIDPEQVYICGFSAGGHLCASLGTLWKETMFSEAFACEDRPWRPSGMILGYPVISMEEEFGHEESRELLMGDEMTPELSDFLSMEKRVSADTVPAFLWATQEDELVPVENSLMFAAALQRHHIPMELHVYEKGEHGLALCDVTTEHRAAQVVPDNADWIRHAIRWIRRRL